MSAGRWKISKVSHKRWMVQCPADAESWDWGNDFGIGQCNCRTFRRWSLARNFVFNRMGAA